MMLFISPLLTQIRQQRWIVFILTALLTCSLIVSYAPSAPRIANLHNGLGKQIVILGDSIASGYGVAPEEAFPALLSRRINVEVLNRGVSGDTTAMGLARLESDVLDEDPWLVMVELGANDYLRQIPEVETEENLREIITRTQAEGAIVVLIGVNLGFVKDTRKQMFERVADETGSYLIPQILTGIITNPEYRQDDVIHPNAAGHQVISDRVFKGLQPLLQHAKVPSDLKSLTF
ncbi:arylesterase [Roseofilum casamattae]|uniref:Arylesterase n=1 Tax=Roseofilum casamattae BLCC-M143 TaxID=3022442 RepID=A0ABT7BSD8_9CYAN|nr:arylesterase [Roseofilum casamattae]MDJ1181687.1 arylesterase [Roseofilum casamattae BLCC-M143]